MPQVKTAGGKMRSYPYTKAGKKAATAAKKKKSSRMSAATKRRRATAKA